MVGRARRGHAGGGQPRHARRGHQRRRSAARHGHPRCRGPRSSARRRSGTTSTAAPDAERLNADGRFRGRKSGRGWSPSFTIAKLAHLARTSPGRPGAHGGGWLPHDWLNLAADRRDSSPTAARPLAPAGGRHATVASGAICWRSRSGGDAAAATATAGGPRTGGARRHRYAPTAAAALGLPTPASRSDRERATTWPPRSASARRPGRSWSVSAPAAPPSPSSDRSRSPTHRARWTVSRTPPAASCPLVCMLNCTRVVDSVSAMVGLPREDALGPRGGRSPPGADGLLLMPYLAGERTPNLPEATGSHHRTDRRERDGRTCWSARRWMGSPPVSPTRSRCWLAVGYRRAGDHARRRRQSAPCLASSHRRRDRTARRRPRRRRARRARGGRAGDGDRSPANQLPSVVERWRPSIIARIEPRPEHRAAFRLDERRDMIEEMKATSQAQAHCR